MGLHNNPVAFNNQLNLRSVSKWASGETNRVMDFISSVMNE